MRLAFVRLPHGFVPSPEIFAQLKDAFILDGTGTEFTLDSDGAVPWWRDTVFDLDRMPMIPFDVKKGVGSWAGDISRIEGKNATPDQSHNKKVNVHVPGLGLLMIDEIRLEEDCCTDRISRLMGEGWRIVAVCPQPNQRRPDYIMGRTKGQVEA